MTAGTYDITCEQGATFSRVLTWTDTGGSLVDLTGYSARMQVRKTAEESAIAVSLSSTGTSTGIALGGVAGTITLLIPAASTAAIPARSYVYDLELVSGAPSSVVTRLVKGAFVVDAEVTR